CIEARRAVTCGGAWSDLLAASSGTRVDVRIVPFRGAYLKLKADRTHRLRGQISPVPDPSLPFLGVHLSPTIHGDVLLGPTALLAGALQAYRLAPRAPPPRARAARRLARAPRASLAMTLRWPGPRKVVRKWWRTGARQIANAASRRLVVRDL